MPQVIAALIPGMGVGVALLGVTVDHVSNRAEVLDLTADAELDVIRLGLSEASGKGKLRLVCHELAGKAEQGVLVDRIASGEGEEFDAREVTRFEEQYQIFLALAFLLLLSEALLSDRRTEEHEWVGRFE